MYINTYFQLFPIGFGSYRGFQGKWRYIKYGKFNDAVQFSTTSKYFVQKLKDL